MGFKPTRTLYKLPDIAENYITISKRLVNIELDCKVKGYYLKLLLIANNGLVNLTDNKIAKLLGMKNGTVKAYNLELQQIGLLSIGNKSLELLPSNLLLDNSKAVYKAYYSQNQQQIRIDEPFLKLVV